MVDPSLYFFCKTREALLEKGLSRDTAHRYAVIAQRRYRADKTQQGKALVSEVVRQALQREAGR